MDFYIAALGRSGSTALANWLTTPPRHVVFHEPSLLREKPTRLIQMQLTDWGITKEQAMAGHWAAKEIESVLHERMIDAYSPPKVILCVRNIREAALSFFEKHRRQGLLDRYSDAWVADYLVQDSAELVRLADRLDAERRPWLPFRYEDFSESKLIEVADWLGWPGGGDMSRGFEAFDRGFEKERERSRGLAGDLVELADTIAQRCSDFERRFYAI